MRKLAALLLSVVVSACAANPIVADPHSDAPEQRPSGLALFTHPGSYAQALQAWRTPEEVNAWIRARFDYDPDRSVLLSETQRAQRAGPAIHTPEAFYVAPKGICVDLARFAVETLRRVAPQLKASYLMIEFDPVAIRGNVLRRHWVATFEREGKFYFFADSKRPGVMAGPYASTQAYISDYARYRGREIVSFREQDSFMRRAKTPAAKQQRDAAAPDADEAVGQSNCTRCSARPLSHVAMALASGSSFSALHVWSGAA